MTTVLTEAQRARIEDYKQTPVSVSDDGDILDTNGTRIGCISRGHAILDRPKAKGYVTIETDGQLKSWGGWYYNQHGQQWRSWHHA